MALVTLATAKDQLEIDTSDIRDETLRLRIDIAEALVLRYIKEELGSPADYSTEADVPKPILACILYQLGELQRFRGDDVEGEGPARDPYSMLSPFVEGILRSYRYPTIA